VETAEQVFFWTSVTILSIFTLEQAVKLLVFGHRYFFWRLWHLLDAIIIITSLVLEIVLRSGALRDVVSLLVIFRLWRIIRVVHAVAESVAINAEDREHKHHEIIKRRGKEVVELKRKLSRLSTDLEVRAAGKTGAPGPAE
jgi:voltage-gated hydrogen channel 1